MTSARIQRSSEMLAPPARLDRAFDDPDRIWSLIEQGAPYKTITAVQKNPPNNDTPGWFRNFWALGEKVIFEGAEDAFYNPAFIEAAKQSFRAKVIRPLAMMTNLNVPAPASPPHLDLPFFRGAHQREVPGWILAPMGYSGLFQPWAIPVASAITWFYEGEGGGFEYWPRGLDSPSRIVNPPYSNTSVLADNEYMYHRVGQTGAPEDWLESGLSSESLLHRDDEDWDIRLGDESIRRYPGDQIRISVLWKAFCFPDQYASDQYSDPAHNLTPDKVVDIFCDDLRKRGVRFAEPASLEDDAAWRDIIVRVYSAPQGNAY